MFRKILVPLDGSSIAEQAIPVAVAIARASRASIDLIRSHARLKWLATEESEELEHAEWHEAARYLEAIAGEIRATADVAVTMTVPWGDAIECICARAEEDGADLIVMTSHGRTGFSRAWLGSVADAVVRNSSVPVLMLRVAEANLPHPHVGPHFRRILVPLDGSSFSTGILPAASAFAAIDDARIQLLRVVSPVPLPSVEVAMGSSSGPIVEDEAATRVLVQEATDALARIARELAEDGVAAEYHVIVDAKTARAIIDFGARHDSDVIAMSSHGRGASRLLIGGIADKVVRGSAVPILLRRPERLRESEPLLTDDEVEQQLASVSGYWSEEHPRPASTDSTPRSASRPP